MRGKIRHEGGGEGEGIGEGGDHPSGLGGSPGSSTAVADEDEQGPEKGQVQERQQEGRLANEIPAEAGNLNILSLDGEGEDERDMVGSDPPASLIVDLPRFLRRTH